MQAADLATGMKQDRNIPWHLVGTDRMRIYDSFIANNMLGDSEDGWMYNGRGRGQRPVCVYSFHTGPFLS